MKPSQAIFNKDTNTVTIHISEYNRLIHNSNLLEDYKELCNDMKNILKGDSE